MNLKHNNKKIIVWLLTIIMFAAAFTNYGSFSFAENDGSTEATTQTEAVDETTTAAEQQTTTEQTTQTQSSEQATASAIQTDKTSNFAVDVTDFSVTKKDKTLASEINGINYGEKCALDISWSMKASSGNLKEGATFSIAPYAGFSLDDTKSVDLKDDSGRAYGTWEIIDGVIKVTLNKVVNDYSAINGRISTGNIAKSVVNETSTRVITLGSSKKTILFNGKEAATTATEATTKATTETVAATTEEKKQSDVGEKTDLTVAEATVAFQKKMMAGMTIKRDAPYSVHISNLVVTNDEDHTVNASGNPMLFNDGGIIDFDFSLTTTGTFQDGDVIYIKPFVYQNDAEDYKFSITNYDYYADLTNASNQVIGKFTVQNQGSAAQVRIVLNENAANSNEITGSISGPRFLNVTRGSGSFSGTIHVGDASTTVWYEKGQPTGGSMAERKYYKPDIIYKSGSASASKNDITWTIDSGDDNLEKLFASGGTDASVKRRMFVEDPLPGGTTIDWSEQFWIAERHSCVISTTDQRYACTTWSEKITDSFTRLIQNSGETYDQFKARIKSAPLQYGSYIYPDSSQVLMCNYGEIGNNGLKYPSPTGQFIQNQYAMTTNYYPVTDEEAAIIETALGSGNVIHGGIPAYQIRFRLTYPKVKVDQITYNTAAVEYDDVVAKTYTASGLLFHLLGEATTAASGCIKVFKCDSDTGSALSGATFKLQQNSGGTWVDYTPGDGIAQRTSDASGFAEFTNVAAGTYRVVETAAKPGYNKDTAYFMPPTFELEASPADGVVVTGYNKANSFSVDFNMQGHGTQVPSQNVAAGGKVTKPTDPTASGFTFGGWYTDSDCSAANKFDFDNDTIAAATTLYAKWTATTANYTVKHFKETGFNTGVFNEVTGDRQILSGTVGATVSGTPKTYTGYTYNPKYIGGLPPTGTIKDDGSLVLELYYNYGNISKDGIGVLTIYKTNTSGTPLSGASFKVEKYDEGTSTWVDFKDLSNHGRTGTTDASGILVFDAIYDVGEFRVVETAAPSGYDKDSTSSSPTQVTLTEDDPEGKLFHVTNSPLVKYDVDFDMKGHGTQVPTQNVTSGAKATKPSDPSASGFAFGGWFTDTNCTAGNEFNFNTPITGNKTLYAKWTATTANYTVKHYKESGFGTRDYNEVTADTQTLNGAVGASVSATAKSYSGYTYNPSYVGSASSGNITEDGKLVLSFYYNYGTVSKGAPGTITLIKTSTEGTALSGAKFKLQKSGSDYIPGDGGALIRTTGTSGTVVFSSVAVGSYQFVETQAATNYDKDSVVYTPATPEILSDSKEGILVKATNELSKYDVTFNMQGHGTQITKQTVNSGSKASEPAAPTETGYVFGGWYTNTACTTGNEFNFNTAITGNITLYAKWTPATGVAYRVEHYKETSVGSGTFAFAEAESKTGTTGATVNAVAKTYSGFVEDTANAGRVASGVVEAGGTLVLKLYYKYNTTTYKVEHYKENSAGSGSYSLAETETKTGVVGTTATAVAKSYTGFTEDTSYAGRVASGTITTSGSGLILKLYYKYADANYTVEHYKQSAPGSAIYTKAETETKSGLVSSTVTATAKSYTGYVENTTHASRVNSGTVAANGGLVLKLYYDLASVTYTVEHYQQDAPGSSTYTITDSETKNGTVNDTVTATAKTYAGFHENTTHADRKVSGTVKADGTLKLKLYYDRNTNTAYKIEHYQQNVSGSGYTIADTENKTGTTGASVSATAKTYEGFHENTTHGSRIASGTIAANGALVLRLYYDRDTNTAYTVEHYQHDLVGSGYTKVDTENLSGTTGASVSATAKTYEGFHENTTYGSRIASGTIAADGTLVLRLYYDRDTNTAYKVEHYKQNVTGGGYTIADTENKFGTTGATATAVAKSYSGFHENTIYGGRVATGTITATGEGLVLKLYYDRDTNTAYKVEHYQQNVTGGGYTLFETENKTGTTGASVTAAAKTYVGFHENTTTALRVASGTVTVSPDPVLVLRLYYDRDTDTGYKVEHYQQNVTGGGYTLFETENKTGMTGATATAVAKSYTGFHENTTYGSRKATGVIDATGALVLKLYYDRNTDTAYKVEHYQQNVTGSGYTLFETEDKAGMTGATVTAVAKSYSGFHENTAYGSRVATGTITATGATLVLKLYYDRDTDTAYKVEHYQQDVTGGGYTLFETENKTGTTGASVTAAAKTYVGFHENTTTALRIASGTVTVSPAPVLVLRLYYDRNTDTGYKVEHYQQNVTGGGYTLFETENKTGMTGATATAVAKSYTGFHENTTYGSRKATGIIDATGVLVLKLYYDRNTDTAYKVEHYQQNVTGGGYTLFETEDKAGMTGATATAVAKSYTGFHENTTYGSRVATGTITATGATLVLKLYYDRDTDIAYTVEHYQQNLTGGGYTKVDTENLTGTTGATVTATAKNYEGFHENTGYASRIPSGTVLANGKLILRLYYDRDTDVTYKVEHYQQDLAGGGYTKVDTESLTGTTGATVNATPKSYDGFHENTTHGSRVPSGVVKGNGALVLKLYYDRNTDTPYKVEHYQQNLTGGGYTKVETENLTGTTGASVTATAKDYEGFTENKTHAQRVATGTITATGAGLVLKLYYDRDTDTAYKVEHYQQNVAGTAYVLKDTDNKTGTTGSTVTAAAKTYPGFTENTGHPDRLASAQVKGNGTLVLKLYYDRNKNTPYKVEHYKQDVTGGGYTLAETDALSGITGDTVTAEAKSYAGFHENTTHADRTATGEIADDGKLVLKLYYDRDTDTQYTVKHFKFDLNGTTYTLADTEHLNGMTGATVTASPKSYEGFTENTTYTGRVETGIIAGDGSLELRLYYNRKTDTKYKVEHYKQNADGSTYTLADTDNKTGTTGAMVTAVAKTYAGYSENTSHPDRSYTGEIRGDGKLVLKLYYDRNKNTPYTVEHYKQDLGGATYSLAATDHLTGTTGAAVTAVAKTFAGFHENIIHVSRVASGNIADEGNLTLRLYYDRDTTTPYKVIHYKQTTGSTYVIADTENLNGITGASVTATAKTYAGYHENVSYVERVASGEIAGEGNLILRLYYDKNTDTPYKVEHYQQDLTGGTYSLADTDHFTGTTGNTVSAATRNYPGFKENTTHANRKASGEITGEGDLVLKLYYDRKTDTPYKVEHYQQNVSGSGYTLKDTDKLTGTTGETATAVAKNYEGFKENTGYADRKASGEITGEGDLVLKLYYDRKTDTPYKVEHYQENLTGGGYTLADTDNLKGMTGATVDAPVKTYPGFHENPDHADRVASGVIAANGSLILKLYYDRNQDTPYKVQHYTQKVDLSDYVLEEEENLTGTTGASVSAVAKSYEGFTENLTTADRKAAGVIEPDGSLVLKLYYDRKTDTPYKVEHYQQNLDGVGYSLADTENLTGVTGATATASAKTYDGFTENTTYAGRIETGIIAGNGSLVLKVYYDRKTDVPYSVEHYKQNLDGSTYTIADTDHFTGTTGAQVSAVSKYYPGFMENTSHPDRLAKASIKGDGTLVLKLYYNRNTNTKYKIEHYKQNLTGGGYTLADTENKTGMTGADVTATAKTYMGFVENTTYADRKASGEIAGDGGLVLKLYYDRRTDTPYKVEHYKQNLSGGYVLEETENLTGMTGATATATIKTYEGFTEDVMNVNRLISGTISENGSLVLKVYYARNMDTKYKVEHYQQDLTGGGYTLADTENFTGMTGATVTADARNYAGFTENKTHGERKVSGAIEANGKLVLKLYYDRNTDTKYKVEHYQQNVSGSGYTLKDTDQFTGTTGDTVTATANTYDGFVENTTYAGRVDSGVIAGNGSLVLKLYYDRKTDTPYKVEHYQQNVTGGGYTLAETDSLTGMTGASVSAVAKTYPGFHENGSHSDRVASGIIDGNGSLKLKLYYDRNSDTAYKVEYYQQNVTATGYDLKESIDKRGITGATVTADAKTYVGFTENTSHPSRVYSGEITADGSLILRLYFDRNTNTKYTVEHYQKNLSGSGYTLADTDVLTGTTGAAVTAVPKAYPGFSEETTNPSRINTGFIEADGSLVLKLYYSRNTDTVYKVEHHKQDLNGSTYTLADTDTFSGTTGAFVSAAAKTYPGFTEDMGNAGRIATGTIAGDGTLVLKLYYNRRTDTRYTVEHYQEKLDGSGYVLADTDTLSATTGETVTAVARTFSGFTENTTYGSRIPSGAVKEDGSLVLKLYYDRNTDTPYTVEHYQKTLNGSGYVLADRETLTGKTGAAVTAAAKTYAGFKENTSYAGRISSGTIAADGSLVLRLYYDRSTTIQYVVEHYKQDLTGGGYTIADTDTFTGMTGATVTAQPRVYAGFTENQTWGARVATGTVEADGSLKLKLYYDRNTDTAYKVEHYQQNVAGNGYTLADTQKLSGKTGDTVTAVAMNYDGFTENTGHAGRINTGIIADDGSLILKLYYDRKDDTGYKVEHYRQNLDGNGYTLADTDTLTGLTGASVTAAPRTYVGFAENTTYVERVAKGVIKGDGSLVLKLYYDRNAGTHYTVEHYKQDVTGGGYTLAEEENFTATTGAPVTATAKSYPGFTENAAHPGRLASGNVEADGSLKLKLYYDRNTNTQYKVEHYLANLTGTGYTLAATDTLHGMTGASVTAVAKPFDGFTENVTAAGRVASGIIADDGSLVLKLYYDRNTDTAYKVEHYKQNADGSSYTLADTDQKTGLTGATATAVAKTYAGYTENTGHPERVATAVIKGNGSLVLKLYYDRNSNTQYKIEHYKLKLDGSGYTLADTDVLYGKTGANVTAAAKTYPGYTENKTIGERVATGVIADDGSLVLKLYYDRATNIPYKVEHYQQTLARSGYVLADTENLTGTTGASVTASPKTYDGFTENTTYAYRKISGEIAADGSLVLKLYYDRNADVKYSVEHYKQNLSGTSYDLEETELFHGVTGDTVTAAAKTYAGYTENKSAAGRVVSGTVLGNGSLVLKLYYDRNTDTAYRVEHYQQNVSKTGYDLKDTEKLSGKTGESVTAVAKAYDGFTENTGYTGRIATGVIADDGDLVLKLYYDRKDDTQYKVEHYQQNLNGGGYTLADTQTLAGTTGAIVTATAKTYEGFFENMTYGGRIAQGEVKGDGSLVLKLYYDRNTDVRYTVKHYQQNVSGAGYTLADTEYFLGKTGASVTAAAKSYLGFTENTAHPSRKATGTIAADGSLILELYYDRDTNTQYKVEHYQRNVSNTGYSLAETDILHGTTGSAVTAVPKTYAGYTENPLHPDRIASGVIAGDGSLVLKLYYDRNMDTAYKVEHYIQNTDGISYTLKDVDNKTGSTGSSVSAVSRTYAGYTINTANADTVAAGIVAGDGSLVLKLYYDRNTNTQYKVEHYKIKTDLSGYDLAETDVLTGTTGDTVNAAPKVYAGFTEDVSNAGRIATGVIAADGSLVLKLYYTRNADTPYTVEHYQQTLSGNAYVLADTQLLAGVTGSVAAATAKDYPGFTENTVYSGRIATGEIKADGSLVLRLYYDRNTNTKYKVEHYKEKTDGSGYALADTDTQTGITGDRVDASARIYPGYKENQTAAGRIASGVIAADGSLVLKLYYDRSTDTQYKVEHYQQNVTQTGYILKETQKLTGITGASVTATARTYDGFTENTTAAGRIAAGTIAEDGSLVLKLYYDRNTDTQYKVEHYKKAVTGDTYVLADTETMTAVTGAEVIAAAKAYDGFVENTSNPSRIPSGTVKGDGSLVLKLYYDRRTDIPYKVEHYKLDTAGTGFDLSETEAFTGKTGAAVTAVPKAYPGFTEDLTNAGRIASGEVKADGSLVLKLYYTRNLNTPYKVEHYQQNISGSGYRIKDTEYLTGTTGLTANATAKTYDGFTENTTYADRIAAGEIKADGSLVLKLYYDRNTDTKYKVEHYQQNLDGVTYALVDTDQMTGTTGAVVTATARTYEGFSENTGYAGRKATGEISGDGSLVLKLYYDRNANTAYKIEYYQQDLGGVTYTLAETQPAYGVTGATAVAPAKSYPGFVENVAHPDRKVTGIIEADGSLVLKLYFDRRSDIAYKVEHYKQNLDNTTYTLSDTENLTGVNGALVSATAKSYAGYTENTGYTKRIATGIITPDGRLVLKLYYDRNSNTGYKVEHYQQNLAGSGYDLKDTDTLSGTTGQNVTALARTYAGFTENKSFVGRIAEGTIAEDGSLVLKLYYDRNTNTGYKVEHYQQNLAGTGYDLKDIDKLSGKTGEAVTATAKAYPGFTENTGHPDRIAAGEIAGDGTLVLKLYYDRSNNVGYKVEHYQQNVSDTGYTLEETETLSGKTGSLVTATAKDYEGFTENTAYAGRIVSGEIAGDGSLVLKLYYDRNINTRYRVEHYQQNLDGTTYTLKDTEQLAGKTGATAKAAGKSYPGFTENTGHPDRKATGSIAADGSLVLKLYYDRNTDTKYKVEHYKQNVGAVTYTLADTENLTGTTGETVTATAKTYAGFTENTAYEGRVVTGEIAGDGSLTLKLYYDRNTDTAYKVEHYQQNLGGSGYTLKDTDNLAGITGAKASAAAKSYPGFTENTAYTGRIPTGIIAGDGSLVLKLYYDRNTNTKYKVEHYQQTLDQTGYTLANTFAYSGTTGETVTAVPMTYAGFTENTTHADRVDTGEIAGDGSLVLKLYYDRKTDTKYKVEHYQENLGGGYTLVDTDTLAGITGATVTATAKVYPGFTENTFNSMRIATGIISGDGSLVLRLYYDRNTDTKYKVEHYKEDVSGGSYTLADTDRFTGTTGAAVNAQAKHYAGFTENTNHADRVAAGVIAADGSLVLKLYYDRNTDTAYKVEHYQQNLSGTGYVLKDTENLSGTTGATATATAKVYPGFTENTGYAQRVASGMIAADGSLVLKLYYDRNTDTAYSVEHYKQNLDGSTYTLADTDHLFGTTGAAVTAAARTYAGFTENTGYPLRMAAGEIKGDGSLVLKLYYDRNSNTQYKVEHYQQSLTGGYDLKDTDTFSGKTGSTVTAQARNYAGFTENTTYGGRTASGVIAEDGSLVLKLYYDRNTDTKYSVEHYKQNLSGSGYTLAERETYTGTTGATVTAAAKTYVGFTENTTYAGRISTGAVAGDGSLILKLYYDRNTNVPYKVEHYKQDLTLTTYTLADTDNFTGTTGAQVSAAARIYQGYTENTIHPSRTVIGEIAGDGSLVLKLYYDRNKNTKYKVEHYKQDLGGATYTLADTQQLTAMTGATVTAAAKSYAGFTENTTTALRVASGEVAEDGSLVLKLYYDRNTNTPYKVEHYQKNYRSSGYTLADTENLTGITGATVTATAKDYPGFTENTTYAGRKVSGEIAADGSLVLKLYYDRNTNTQYRVEHYKQNVGGSGYTLADTDVRAGTTGETVLAEARSYAGFTENTTYGGRIDSGIIAGDGTLVLKLYYDRDTKVAYTIEHYQEDLGTALAKRSAGYTLKYVEKLTGTTGDHVVAAAKIFPGYTENTGHPERIVEGDIAGDGSLVLRLYYDRDTTTQYHVEHYKKAYGDSSYTLADRETKTGITGETVTAVPNPYTGYKENTTYAGRVVSGKITADGSLVLKLYYDEETTSVQLQKKWSGDMDGVAAGRPDSVKVQLYADGAPAGDPVSVSGTGNTWDYSWKAVKKYNASGDEISYTVQEISSGTDYKPSYSKEGSVLVITNQYQGSVVAAEGEYAQSISKKLTGDNPKKKGTFKFMMTAKTSGAAMPSGSMGMSKTITITGAGTAGFGPIKFTKAGTFEYEIRELNTGLAGYTYDQSTYTLTTVVGRGASGIYEARITLKKDGSEVHSVEFTNDYDKTAAATTEADTATTQTSVTTASTGTAGGGTISGTGGTTGGGTISGNDRITGGGTLSGSGTSAGSGTISGTGTTSKSGKSTGAAKTGDQSQSDLFGLLAGLAGLGIVITISRRKKEQ